MPRLMAAVRPLVEYVLCARCGIDAPDTSRATTGWRCPDCRDLECGNGHLWPEVPALSVRGRRRCLLCENQRRRILPSPKGPAQ